MPKEDNIWMPLFFADWAEATEFYTAVELACYIQFRVQYWKNADSDGGYLPQMDDQRIMRLCKLESAEQLAAAKGLLESLFDSVDGKLINAKWNFDISKANRHRKNKRKAGKISANNRKSKEIDGSREGTDPTTEGITEEEQKPPSRARVRTDSQSESKKEEETMGGGKKYAFQGGVIRITEKDFATLEKNYKHIPDMLGELATIDAWYVENGVKPEEKWWMRLQGMLNKKNQDNAKAAKIEGGPPKESGKLNTNDPDYLKKRLAEHGY